ncbi:MAG: hypothetical protein H7144_14880 [Burkholderiales bacterium]|nr:hypothetical protein [Phycisphaerae bacterium]
MIGPVLVAALLEQLGYDKLLGTPAHLYMDKFVSALALHLAALQDELPDAIEAKLAHRTAKRSVDELRHWYTELNGLG